MHSGDDSRDGAAALAAQLLAQRRHARREGGAPLGRLGLALLVRRRREPPLGARVRLAGAAQFPRRKQLNPQRAIGDCCQTLGQTLC